MLEDNVERSKRLVTENGEQVQIESSKINLLSSTCIFLFFVLN